MRSSGLTVSQVISADALRMRLRRFCTVKKSGKCAVDDTVRASYNQGGEQREWLEIALLEAIKKHGTTRESYNKVKDHLFAPNNFCQLSPFEFILYIVGSPYIELRSL